MARDTITAQFQVQARFETLQAIRQALADGADMVLVLNGRVFVRARALERAVLAGPAAA